MTTHFPDGQREYESTGRPAEYLSDEECLP